MIRVIKNWIDKYLSDPEAILLLAIIAGTILMLNFFGDILTPVLVSIAIAMLLQIWVSILEKYKCPHAIAYWLVYLLFLAAFIGALLFLLPLLWRQGVNLLSEMPTLIINGKSVLLDFVHSQKNYLSSEYVESILQSALAQSDEWTKDFIAASLATIPGIITWVVYVVLMPLLVFFFLRDHKQIITWFKSFLPQKRSLLRRVWVEMNDQVGNYIKGKITEIVIIGIVTYFVFLFFDLRYQVLLASLVGLSVVIPYVGVVLVTIPVVLVGYFQWGFDGGLTGQFALMLYSYTFVQLVDGAILVPLLFSEAVHLHPIAIIIAILFFGAIWGFWGVFFAIPLATLVKALINAWPQRSMRGKVSHY